MFGAKQPHPERSTPTVEELATQLREHELWRESTGTSGTRLDLRGQSARHLNFNDKLCQGADLRDASLVGSNLVNLVALTGSSVEGADLSGLLLEQVPGGPVPLDLTNCCLDNCVINGVRFDKLRLVGTRGLWGPRKAMITESCKGQEWATYTTKRDFLSWESLRSIGQIRLFGISYAAFIALVLYSQAARAYRAWVEALMAAPQDSARHALGVRLPPLETPTHFAALLIAIALLSVGATVYALRCPDIVKEYSHAKWSRELKQPFAEYASAKYSRWKWRYLAGFTYGTGALLTVGYLLLRGLDAFMWFIGAA